MSPVEENSVSSVEKKKEKRKRNKEMSDSNKDVIHRLSLQITDRTNRKSTPGSFSGSVHRVRVGLGVMAM